MAAQHSYYYRIYKLIKINLCGWFSKNKKRKHYLVLRVGRFNMFNFSEKDSDTIKMSTGRGTTSSLQRTAMISLDEKE